MSAEVTPMTWGWFCSDCCEGGDGPSEDEAASAADQHDEEQHQ
jgi:hypothetical protein